MTPNYQVALAWKEGRKAKSHNMSTDGQMIKSWNLIIGITLQREEKVGLDYTKRGEAFYSQSTTKHVGCVTSVTNMIMTPKEAERHGFI